MRHIITATVVNHPGVLAHISALFSARGFNIDSVTVGRTEDPAVSRMTIVAGGDDQILEQVVKQLRKVIDVIKVQDLTDSKFVERDLMLLRVNVAPSKRVEVMEIINIFRAKVVDISPIDLMIEVSGPEAKLDAIVAMMQQYGIKELSRTGCIAMKRGKLQ